MARFERSCGIVLFFQPKAGPREYLLLHYPTGHWDFAKGHIEKGEEDITTALREAKEETGLEGIEIVPNFRHRFEYRYRRRDHRVHKEVGWFLGRAPTKAVRLSYEHKGFRWLAFEPALEQVTYANAKDLLRKAEAHLRGVAPQESSDGAAPPSRTEGRDSKARR